MDGYEILTPQEMYEADALASAKFDVRSLTLMENAGQAVADEITGRFKKCRVAVICGPGNNGGDGFVVARLLAAKKWSVTVFLTGEAIALKGDAAAMFKKWRREVHSFGAIGESFVHPSQPQLIVDAIFGAGLNREMPADWVAAIAAAKLPVVSIDVPSGLDGATGLPIGSCLQSDLTVTFFRKKPGHLLLPGRILCGETVVKDIGLPHDVLGEIAPSLWENETPVLPAIFANDHKYTRGHATVWSGPELAAGASRLAAMAAARVGAGLVTLVGTHDALRIHAAHVSSIMLKIVAGESDLVSLLEDQRISAFCIGPGAGVSVHLHRAALALLHSGVACVLDADALTCFAEAPDELFKAIKTHPSRPVVMTPHMGEFYRLFPQLKDSIESKVEVARNAAAASGAVVVLKCADTVIASPDHRAKINSNAPAKLATAGSGDVLAGIITGFLAQGVDGFDAACAGVWLHGDAANRCARSRIMAEDLVEQLGVEQ